MLCYVLLHMICAVFYESCVVQYIRCAVIHIVHGILHALLLYAVFYVQRVCVSLPAFLSQAAAELI